MRKRVILALLLVVALFVTSGCGLIVKDEEVDRQTPIVEVAGKVFTKGEVTEMVNYNLDYQEYMYSMYGMAFDKADPAVIASAQEGTINSLVRQAVLEKKATDMGMDSLTEDELAAVQAKTDETYTGYVDSVKSEYFAETELTGEALDSAIQAKMTELGYPTKDSLLTSEKAAKAQEKLKADAVKDVTVSEEELRTKYGEKVEAEKTSYESNLPAYGSAVSSGTTVYYAPAGYRYVKNLLRKLSEEDTQAITDQNSVVDGLQTQLDEANTTLASLKEDPAQDTPEEAQLRTETQANLEKLTADLGTEQTKLTDLQEAAYAKLQPTIDEILQKVAQGANFDDLVKEYGEDDGMKAEPAINRGYLVCAGDTQWVPEFTEGAMALEKIGDVSGAIRTDFGIHLLQYASDELEGPVPFDNVKDALQAELLTQKQDELFETTVGQWMAEANAKIDFNALH